MDHALLNATATSPETISIQRCGYLFSTDTQHGGDWTRRWYSWLDGFLVTSTAPTDKDMQPVLRGVLVNAALLPGVELLVSQPMYGFHILSATGEAQVLYATCEAGRARWLRAISCAGRPTALSDHYKIDFTAPVGSGLTAIILPAKEKQSGDRCAIKMIKPQVYRTLRPMLDRELAVWASLDQHPNLLELRDVLRSHTRVYYATELCMGGSLMHFLASAHTYSEQDASRIMRQVLEALHHLHSSGVVHCDVKPENICMATQAPESPIKLIDFGMASFVRSPMEPGGTPEFVAPELLQRPEHYAAHGCGPEVDIWSAGVLLFYLLCGKTPFYASNVDGIISRVKTGTWAFKGTAWDAVSEPPKALIRRMLQVKPSSRPSAAELLQDAWLKMPSRAPMTHLSAATAAFVRTQTNSLDEGPAASKSGATMPRSGSAADIRGDAAPENQLRPRNRRAQYASCDGSSLDQDQSQHAGPSPKGGRAGQGWQPQGLLALFTSGRAKRTSNTGTAASLPPPPPSSTGMKQPAAGPSIAAKNHVQQAGSSGSPKVLGTRSSSNVAEDRPSANRSSPATLLAAGQGTFTSSVPPMASLGITSPDISARNSLNSGLTIIRDSAGDCNRSSANHVSILQALTSANNIVRSPPGNRSLKRFNSATDRACTSVPSAWTVDSEEAGTQLQPRGSLTPDWQQRQQQQQQQQQQGSSERLRQIQQLQEQVMALRLAVAAKGQAASPSYAAPNLTSAPNAGAHPGVVAGIGVGSIPAIPANAAWPVLVGAQPASPSGTLPHNTVPDDELHASTRQGLRRRSLSMPSKDRVQFSALGSHDAQVGGSSPPAEEHAGYLQPFTPGLWLAGQGAGGIAAAGAAGGVSAAPKHSSAHMGLHGGMRQPDMHMAAQNDQTGAGSLDFASQMQSMQQELLELRARVHAGRPI